MAKFRPINGWTKKKIIAKLESDFTEWSGSLNDTACFYRKSKNAKCQVRCAVGVFIPDAVYEPNMDKTGGVEDLLDVYPSVKKMMPLSVLALSRLQLEHDRAHSKGRIDTIKADLINWVKENVS